MHVVKRKEGRKRRGEDEKKGLLLAIFWKTTTDNRMLNMIFVGSRRGVAGYQVDNGTQSALHCYTSIFYAAALSPRGSLIGDNLYGIPHMFFAFVLAFDVLSVCLLSPIFFFFFFFFRC